MTPTRFSRLIGHRAVGELQLEELGRLLDDRGLVGIRPQAVDRVVDEQEAVVERAGAPTGSARAARASSPSPSGVRKLSRILPASTNCERIGSRRVRSVTQRGVVFIG
jgi:hypothetical protein